MYELGRLKDEQGNFEKAHIWYKESRKLFQEIDSSNMKVVNHHLRNLPV